MKTRYFIELSYKGTHYHGWQYQENAITVQHLINEALSTLLRESIETFGAGRTDTGVHAPYYVAHFDATREDLDLDRNVKGKLNIILPRDIVIHSITKMNYNAHARFDAISRTYEYHICLVKDPFKIEFAHFRQDKLDIDLMNAGAAIINKTVDFTSFSKLHTEVKTNNCYITYSKWEQQGNMLIYTIKADRFLRNMVRAIVGTLVDIGRGHRSIENLQKIIDSKNRGIAGKSLSPQGLFLTDIEYPESYGLKKPPLKSF